MTRKSIVKAKTLWMLAVKADPLWRLEKVKPFWKSGWRPAKQLEVRTRV